MLRGFLVAASILSVAAPAWADVRNVDKAMNDAVATFRSGGFADLEDAAKLCYSGLSGPSNGRNVSAEVEYCVSLEFTGALLNREAGKAGKPTSQYFNGKDVTVRAAYNLEKNRIVTLPEQFAPYMDARIDRIERKLPKL